MKFHQGNMKLSGIYQYSACPKLLGKQLLYQHALIHNSPFTDQNLRLEFELINGRGDLARGIYCLEFNLLLKTGQISVRCL